MKALSSAIVVAVGMYGLQTFLPLLMVANTPLVPFFGVAICVGLLCGGMAGWWASLKNEG